MQNSWHFLVGKYSIVTLHWYPTCHHNFMVITLTHTVQVETLYFIQYCNRKRKQFVKLIQNFTFCDANADWDCEEGWGWCLKQIRGYCGPMGPPPLFSLTLLLIEILTCCWCASTYFINHSSPLLQIPPLLHYYCISSSLHLYFLFVFTPAIVKCITKLNISG